MCDETSLFLHYLLARCESFRQTSCLTVTAMHPDRTRPCPSRHIPLDDPSAVDETLEHLFAANALGWGAYVAVGLRRSALGRWRRGGIADMTALPALFVDVDDPSPEILKKLRSFSPMPSCIVHSGGGYHAYWWLEELLTDLSAASLRLQTLNAKLNGDSLSVAHSLRLPGTVNTKPERSGARCHLIDLRDEHYPLTDFEPLSDAQVIGSIAESHSIQPIGNALPQMLNPNLIAAVTDIFAHHGYRRRGDWLNGPCVYPQHHRHGDRHPSFGFNTRTGYGFCYVCGSILLKDLCAVFDIQPDFYGGICP